MAQSELSEAERAALANQLERLREEHRDLDVAIEALRQAGQADQLQVQRLKKRKLALRGLGVSITNRISTPFST